MGNVKRVEVKWYDSNFIHGWQMEGEIPIGLALCESVGYKGEEDDEKLVLLQTKSDFGAHMGILAIPKACVKSIKELRSK